MLQHLCLRPKPPPDDTLAVGFVSFALALAVVVVVVAGCCEEVRVFARGECRRSDERHAGQEGAGREQPATWRSRARGSSLLLLLLARRREVRQRRERNGPARGVADQVYGP